MSKYIITEFPDLCIHPEKKRNISDSKQFKTVGLEPYFLIMEK